MFKALSFILLFASVRIAAAQAPPTVKEEVVVTATLTPLPVSALMRSVHLLTAEPVTQQGLGWTFNALRFVPGVDPRARGPMGVQTDF